MQKTSDLIGQNNKSFLWGCKCRSGKTYMLGGLIAKQLEAKVSGGLNVLVITPAPTETLPQFTEDLFRKFRDFSQFSVHQDIKCIDLIGKNNIFVVSK